MVKVNNEHLQSNVNNFGSKSSHFLNELLKLKVFLYLKNNAILSPTLVKTSYISINSRQNPYDFFP